MRVSKLIFILVFFVFCSASYVSAQEPDLNTILDALNQQAQAVGIQTPGIGGGVLGGCTTGTCGFTPNQDGLVGTENTANVTGRQVGSYKVDQQGNLTAVGQQGRKADLSNFYQGLPQEFRGYKRSPILFDPETQYQGPDKTSKRKRVYPPYSYFSLAAKGANAYQSMDVDQEVVKSSMAIYQSFDRMETSFLDSEKKTDEYLNTFEKVRAIAHLTLSYLDKTVSAGLATVKMQASEDTTHQLLKQINWSAHKIANPDHYMVHYDTEEKFNACMMKHATDATGARIFTDEIIPQHVMGYGQNGNCEKCEEEYDPAKSPYHFCVCCAERSIAINAATNTNGVSCSTDKGENATCYSVVERLFLGLTVPEAQMQVNVGGDSENGIGNAQQKYVQYAQYFRSLYGDVVMVKDQAGANSAGGQQKWRIKNVPPRYSPTTWVKLLRDFKDMAPHVKFECNESTQLYGDFQVTACPITGTSVENGICPSLKALIGLKANDTSWATLSANQPGTLQKMFVEASLGGPLSVEDLENFVKMNANQIRINGETDATISHTPQLRLIESYCDAAAVNAFKQLHLRMMSIAMDHLLLNRKSTRQDKQIVSDAMARVSSYLELAARDRDTDIDIMQVALGVQADRIDEANRAVAHGSIAAAAAQQGQNNSVVSFGGTVRCIDGSC